MTGFGVCRINWSCSSKQNLGLKKLGAPVSPQIFFWKKKKISSELTSVPIFLYFICGMPATAWLDEWCVRLHLGSELANPGPQNRST